MTSMTKACPTKEYIINAIRKVTVQYNFREFSAGIRNEFRGKGVMSECLCVPQIICWNSKPQGYVIRM